MIQEQEIPMKNHHFLITTFPLQGHINPTLQLAKILARGGARVTFATTTAGLSRLRNSLATLNNLSFTSFSDGRDGENTTTGADFAAYMADLRRVGSQNLTKILQTFLHDGQPVSCIVYTMLFPWVAAVAREMHVPSAFLSIQCATAFAIYHKFYNTHDGLTIHESRIDSSLSVEINPDLPLFSSIDLPTFLLPDNPINQSMGPIMLEHIQELEKDPKSMIFLNTFQELEQESIKSLNKNLNVIPIGPLIPSAFSDGQDLSDKSFGGDLFVKNEDHHYFEFLNSKPEKSVVYVAFGSLVMMKKEQKDEILHGLVESKRPFLWAIRSIDSEEEVEMKKVLENNGDQGMMVKWCSQMEVLSHKSTGCFVTHCGWNSTLEGLTCGVPLIGCPQFSDQVTNAKMVEEVWGVGVRARINGEVVIERGQLKKCLDIVMGESERGKEIRENASKWRGLALDDVSEGGSTWRNLKNVLESRDFK